MNTVIGEILILTFLNLHLHNSSFILQQKPSRDFIRSVQNADQFFYFNEDYDKASTLYDALLKSYPDNRNIKAKLGICYLNLDGKKNDALKLLENASEDVVKSDPEYLEYGTKAPLDTWFYLAHAFHITNDLTKAISLYESIKKKTETAQTLRIEYIDNQIKACKYAIEMEKNPLNLSEELLIPWLKDWPGANHPVLSENDSVFVFTQRIKGKNHVYCSFKTTDWKRPVEITSQLGEYENIESNSITADGDMLIVYMDEGADGNLYSSSRKGSDWTRLKKLNKNINTKYWEAFGFITGDGKQLFFSSNRPGGSGDLDIWVSQKEENGNWGPAINLGTSVNSPYNDNAPSFIQASGTLLFCSVGQNGMGGYDLFSSVLKDGKWTKPIGLPYPVNTTSDNIMFIDDPENKGLITSLVEDKTGIRNIYRIIQKGIPSSTVAANGNVGLQDGMNIESGLAEVKLAKADSSDSWKKIDVNESGKYKFDTKPGDYIVQIKYPGYKTDTINLIIPKSFTGKSLALSTSMIPEKVFSGDFLSIKNILFAFDSYSLDGQAKFDLEKVKSLLINWPDLKIEVTGYTDIRGSSDYNKILADRRAASVINYLTTAGIPESTFLKKAAGATDFIAINVNKDGSDNPEGRRVNRRVTLGVINPQTGISIKQESYTPPGLREPSSMRYGIVLIKSKEKFYPDYFSDFSMNEIIFVRPVFRDSVYLYILGDFYDRSDAESYLKFAREKGFTEGYIVNQYEIMEPPHLLMNKREGSRRSGSVKSYAIQLSASTTRLNINIFKGVEKVTEIKGNDGYYRYVYGEFDGFSKAKAALENVHKSGYMDAFIKEYNMLIKQ